MFGDLYLAIKKFLIQNFFCIHDYKTDRIGIITGLYNGFKCSKCGKFKDV